MKILKLFPLISISKLAYSQNDGANNLCGPGSGVFENRPRLPEMMDLESIVGDEIECEDGKAGDYLCKNIALQSYITGEDLHGGLSYGFNDCNDLWGWSKDGRDFALVGMIVGTSFVEVTDPINPVVLGLLLTENTTDWRNIWKDIKTYDHYAFIGSEVPDYGMQIFDLDRLLDVTTFTNFTKDAHYVDFGSSHNIFINEDTAWAYVVGSDTCDGGLHFVNISNPLNATFGGCCWRKCIERKRKG